jgi:small subunit ribosomal protein S5
VLVVLGDRSGRVGVGVSNAVLLREALGEARRRAVRGLVDVQVTKSSSIRHMTHGHFRAASVVLRPRPTGSGVVAGGAVRPVLEMAGLKNVTAKSLGSNSVVNSARATIDALKRLVKMEPK